MERIIIFTLILNLLCMPVLALEFDTSIDDEIRKNYNPDKLEQDMGLPPLPKILDETNAPTPKTQKLRPISNVANIKKPQSTVVQQATLTKLQTENCSPANAEKNIIQVKPASGNCIVLKHGTKIKVRLVNSISDKTKIGTRVKFVSIYPVTTTYFTIPMGTEFDGKIINAHRPQLAANGGLIAIRINSIVFNSGVQPINAYVTKANSKKIFFNNIKGKRRYLSSMYKSTKNGRHFYSKMMRLTTNLTTDGSSIVLAPFSICVAVVTLGGNILVSPALALLYKGGSISINSGTEFEIKLSQDVYIYN